MVWVYPITFPSRGYVPFVIPKEMAGQNPNTLGWGRELIQLFPTETGNHEEYNSQEKAIFADKSGIDAPVNGTSWTALIALG